MLISPLSSASRPRPRTKIELVGADGDVQPERGDAAARSAAAAAVIDEPGPHAGDVTGPRFGDMGHVRDRFDPAQPARGDAHLGLGEADGAGDLPVAHDRAVHRDVAVQHGRDEARAFDPDIADRRVDVGRERAAQRDRPLHRDGPAAHRAVHVDVGLAVAQPDGAVDPLHHKLQVRQDKLPALDRDRARQRVEARLPGHAQVELRLSGQGPRVNEPVGQCQRRAAGDRQVHAAVRHKHLAGDAGGGVARALQGDIDRGAVARPGQAAVKRQRAAQPVGDDADIRQAGREVHVDRAVGHRAAGAGGQRAAGEAEAVELDVAALDNRAGRDGALAVQQAIDCGRADADVLAGGVQGDVIGLALLGDRAGELQRPGLSAGEDRGVVQLPADIERQRRQPARDVEGDLRVRQRRLLQLHRLAGSQDHGQVGGAGKQRIDRGIADAHVGAFAVQGDAVGAGLGLDDLGGDADRSGLAAGEGGRVAQGGVGVDPALARGQVALGGDLDLVGRDAGAFQLDLAAPREERVGEGGAAGQQPVKRRDPGDEVLPAADAGDVQAVCAHLERAVQRDGSALGTGEDAGIGQLDVVRDLARGVGERARGGAGDLVVRKLERGDLEPLGRARGVDGQGGRRRQQRVERRHPD
ncbi:hypothetical protein [Pseudooceanicola sp. LIPI14-2-Ac024]|uniref:hypothetical protein n=1 Tax=Pseudooceanicola sp. LIPI14-2-Ac024 TaxID=3344875 RepID=UPI0035D035E7